MYDSVRSLLELVQEAVSPWHTVQAVRQRLAKAGFQALSLSEKWELAKGQSYYVEAFDSTLLAFSVGNDGYADDNSLRIAASHTDFPGIRIKPQASVLKSGYGVLNIESYGGLILSSWQDRPLSIAGKVVLKGANVFQPEVRIVDFAKPLLTIPSLAIHMNRKVNEGVALKKQKEMLPLMAVLGKDGDKAFCENWLASELGCEAEDILSYELNLYPYEPACQLGLAGELVSAPRLDNITSVEACLQGIISASRQENACGIRMAAFFDNEEIGSRTKQGAGSGILLEILERIYLALGYDRDTMWQAVSSGFMLSVDVAHALHPNYPEKYDPYISPVLNGGVALKQAASQSYAGDAQAVAIVKSICQQGKIPHQIFVNHADQAGGSTLGSIASALVPMRTMDIGIAMLAMHSARETMGAADQQALNELIAQFYLM